MKSEILIALYALVVYFLFSLACMMVTLKNGSSWWITKKLRFGAILLSISPTLMVGCPPPPTSEFQSYSDDHTENESIIPSEPKFHNLSREMNAMKPDSLIHIIEPIPLD